MKVLDLFIIRGRGVVVTVTLDKPLPERAQVRVLASGLELRRARDGASWPVLGVEWFATMRRPKTGDTVGLLVGHITEGISTGDDVELVDVEAKGGA